MVKSALRAGRLQATKARERKIAKGQTPSFPRRLAEAKFIIVGGKDAGEVGSD